MEISRRSALAGLAALASAPAAAETSSPAPAYIAALKDRQGFAAVLLDAAGEAIARADLPARGHGAAVSRQAGLALVFARRPGGYALVFDLASRRPAGMFAPPAERRFNGHGAFSADGRLLYASENDFEAARGAIGVYDVAGGWRRIGEFPSHGVGPHELLRLEDGHTLVVANGGIATHPDLPRVKLNLADMQPSLAYIDSRNGELLDRADLPSGYHQLSIRHLVQTARDEVWWSGQYEGPAEDTPPLVGVHRRGGPIDLLGASADVALRNYAGAIAFNGRSGHAAVSSPRGGRAQIYDVQSRRLIETRLIGDVCGLAPRAMDFLASDGHGRLHDGARTVREAAGVAWDNHLVRV